MKFRVVFTDGVEEYYKKNSTATHLSLLVDASSFNQAILVAQVKMETMVLWTTNFHVVSVDRVEEEEEKREIKLLPDDWCRLTGIQIMDADGWDRKNYEKSWGTPVTREDFIKRATRSTCHRWPSPLLDERG